MEGKKVDEALNDIRNTTEEYIASLKLNIKLDPAVESILNATKDEIDTWDGKTCDENSTILSRHALFLQMEYNRHMMNVLWADNNLRLIYGRESESFNSNKYVCYEEKKDRILMSNSMAKSLFTHYKTAKQNAEVLRLMMDRVDSYSKQIFNLGRRRAGNAV